MKEYSLSDPQWCFLDLLMRAKQRGVTRLNRLEILNSPSVPEGARLKLVWAGLTMPTELVRMIGQHDFEITDEGASLYNLRFGKADLKPAPTDIADAVICLPGPSGVVN